MNRKTVTTLIEQYFQSWIQQDVELFLSTLSPSITVQECYGPVYVGTEEVRQWFVEWHTGKGNGKVTDWTILKILYDESQHTAAVEWDLTCRYCGEFGTFLGASIFQFDRAAIVRIQEYKMEKKQYRPYKSQYSRATNQLGLR